jgi:speckle-type POZ protein
VKLFVFQIECSTICRPNWVNLLCSILIWLLLLIFTAIRRIILAGGVVVLFKMAEFFNWIRPGYELVTARLLWNIQLRFFQPAEEYVAGGILYSTLFSPQETPNRKWELSLCDIGTKIAIYAFHCNSMGNKENVVIPALLKIWILDRNGRKIFQQMVISSPDQTGVKFNVSKVSLMKSIFEIDQDCILEDVSLTFCCKIFTHVEIAEIRSVSPADPAVLAFDCTGGLSSHLEELFNDMSLSDVTLNIGDHEFPAHKLILSARSKYFAAMFKHPMKENLTNQIKIEDTEPEVFQELLHFIYTGRVSKATMETMATGLFVAADKYLLEELKTKCENYLVLHMSPDNCVVLLLHGDLLNPAEPLKEAAKYLRRFPNEVTASERWKKMKQEDPAVLCEIHQFVLCLK